jgi:uncharacterized membrane protein YcaP (DUF421 family)
LAVALFIILRAAFGYLFLILMVRIVGRRPGKQLIPFEFVLIFYLGGLTLTGMVGRDAPFANAVTEILTVALLHYILSYLRYRFAAVARLLDGTPLVIIKNGDWQPEAVREARIRPEDVEAAARAGGVTTLEKIDDAVLERNGAISVFPKES